MEQVSVTEKESQIGIMDDQLKHNKENDSKAS